MIQPAQLHNEFLSKVISSDILEEAKIYVSILYTPEEVFDIEILNQWAENNGYILDEQ
jgi:hypothetical protein